MYDPTAVVTERMCTVYSLTQSHQCLIELQPCTICPSSRRRFIGPDPRPQGVFNYNNSILFTHELLDEYTSAYTSSETPFVAWIGVVARRYTQSQSTFVGEETFRSVWFAYARLQQLAGDMQCTECGPCPDEVIWDGVTLAFGRKHVLETLRPPTTLHKDPPVRSKCKYRSKQQLIIDPEEANDDILEEEEEIVASGTALTADALSKKAAAEAKAKVAKAAKAIKDAMAAMAHIDLVEELRPKLLIIDPGLESLFTEHFGVVAIAAHKKPPTHIRQLFVQVRLAVYSFLNQNVLLLYRSVRRSRCYKWQIGLL